MKRSIGRKLLAGIALAAALSARAVAPPVATPLGSVSAPAFAPARVAIDAAGHLYAADSQAGRLAVFDAFGRLTRMMAGFAGPLGLAVDAGGRLYVAEAQAGRVTVLDAQGAVTGHLGAGDGEFLLPNFIAADPSPGSGLVFVSDTKAGQVRAYTNGAFAFSFGSAGTNVGQFNGVSGICATTNELFVVDQFNGRAQVFDHNGAFLRSFLVSWRTGSLSGPTGRCLGIGMDATGRVYVADAFQGYIRAFDAIGTKLTTIGAFGSALGQLNSPADVALDGFGRMFVASENNARIEIFGIGSFIQLTSSIPGRFAAAGTNLVLTITTGGTNTYAVQWQKDGTNLVDGGSVSGSTAAVLSVANLGPADGGTYSALVSGPAGPLTCQADPLAVLVPPAVIVQPAATNPPLGAIASFAAAAQGDLLTYQWLFNGQPIPGATNDSYAIASVAVGDEGDYALRVQNPVGVAVSDPAALHVITPPVIVHDPTDLIVVQGEPAKFFSLAEGEEISYQWRINGVPLLGEYLNYVQIDQASPDSAGAFSVLASNVAGVATSAVASLRVLVPPTLNEVGAIVIQPDGSAELALFGDPGYPYALDASANLVDWEKLGNVDGAGGAVSFVDVTSATNGIRFYRLRWSP